MGTLTDWSCKYLFHRQSFGQQPLSPTIKNYIGIGDINNYNHWNRIKIAESFNWRLKEVIVLPSLLRLSWPLVPFGP